MWLTVLCRQTPYCRNGVQRKYKVPWQGCKANSATAKQGGSAVNQDYAKNAQVVDLLPLVASLGGKDLGRM